MGPLVGERVTAVFGEAVEYRPHHIGIAVGNERAARRTMSTLGLTPSWSNVLERHECRCDYCPGPLLDIELVIPLSAASSTRKIPPGLHHLGVQVTDIAAAQQALTQRGYAMLEPEPLNILDRYLVNFIEPLRVGFLVELVQELGAGR